MAFESVQEIAKQTGGETIFVQKTADMGPAFARVTDDLHKLYVIGYSPDPRLKSNSFHKLKIETKQKGLHVIAPELFYVPKRADNSLPRPK